MLYSGVQEDEKCEFTFSRGEYYKDITVKIDKQSRNMRLNREKNWRTLASYICQELSYTICQNEP